MAAYQALGTGPVSFLDTNDAQQEIPLSAITFGPSGADASAWTGYAANTDLVKAILAQMVQQGLLKPGAQAAPVPSLTITAAENGPIGNMITVTFANPSTAAGTVDVTVGATETYLGVTPATLAATIGSPNEFLTLSSQNPAKTMPVALGATPLTGATLVVPDAGGVAPGSFTLAATDSSFKLTVVVTIDPVVAPNPPTFTLTVTGTKTVTGLTLAKLQAPATNPFKMLVTFAGPAGGPIPAAGLVTLQGGAAATSTPAAPAVATAFST